MKTIVILSHVGFDDSPYCNYVHNHAKALAKQGYHVIVLAVIHWLPVISNFQKYKKNFKNKISKKNKIQYIDGVEVRYTKAMSFSNLLYDSKINLNGFLYYQAIKKEFKKINEENDIVLIDAHTFKVEGYVAYRLKKKYPNIMTTVTLHGTSFDRNTHTKNGIKLIKKIFGKVDYAICVSYKLHKILDFLGVINSKVIFNGINKYDIKKVEKNKFNMISVGNLKKGKKFDITIKVFDKLKKDYPDLRLTIVGSGIELDNIKKLAEELNIKDSIKFNDRLTNEEVLNLMNESFIFVLPSINEGFGIVYAEAMSAGCITIGTKNEGIDGFIKNEENGFLVNADVNEISDLIKKIYENKYNIEKIKENAYKSVEKLTWENNVKEYIELLEDKK